MAMGGEKWRFWIPVGLLLIFSAYATQKLVRAHIDPFVDSNDYTLRRKLDGTRGSIYDSTGCPLVKSVPVWDYHLDPVSLTNRVVRQPKKPPRTREEIVKTIAEALGLDYAKVLGMSANTRRRYQPLAVSSNPDAYRTLADSSLVAGVEV